MSQAIVIAGGKGTRISDLYPDRPKALIPVGGEPFLKYQFDLLREAGYGWIHLALGHMAQQVWTWLGPQHRGKPHVTSSCEREALGNGRGAEVCPEFHFSDPFMVVNGDTLVPKLDIRAMTEFHASHDGPITLCVTQVEDAGRYGSVISDDDGWVTEFIEKGATGPGRINGGYYIADRSVLDEIPEDSVCSMEQDVFAGWAGQKKIRVFEAPPPLLDMGTPDGLEQMEAFLRSET